MGCCIGRPPRETITVTLPNGTATTTTTTTTLSTPACAKSISDSSLYEVRTYYNNCIADYDATVDSSDTVKSPYAQWFEKVHALTATLLDVQNGFTRITNTPTTIHATGSRSEIRNDFEKKNPACGIQVCWTIRWDSLEHAEKVWGKFFSNPEILGHVASNPFINVFARMESRFMRSVGITPTRFCLRSKIYEVRNATVDTSVIPWNAETRNRFALYVEEMSAVGSKARPGGLDIHSIFIAEAEPVTKTVSGPEILGGDKYDGGNTVPPHVCWIAAWDSKEQADQTWAKISSSAATVQAQQEHQNPFLPNPENLNSPSNHYLRLESVWMTNCFNSLFD